MRFLGVGGYNSLADMYWRLSREGHDIKVFIENEEAHGIFRGMLPRTSDWRQELDWVRGDDGIIVFETIDHAELQDELRAAGFLVVGGSQQGNRLESDRAFGQSILRAAGLQVAASHAFEDFPQGLDFIRRKPGRYVFKLNDAEASSSRNYVGELEDGSDVCAVIAREQRRGTGARPSFVLMERVSGVEVGVGAYFNGHAFLRPACLDWEHKRFFPGDLGELTGEMGTLVTYRGYERIFEQTLLRMTEFLTQAGYRGYINLNTIINEHGIWPLEFTCRFGYPGFAICDELHGESWAGILSRMARGEDGAFATHEGYSIGVVLTVPPFPHEFGYAQLSRGAPIFFRDGLTADDPHVHLCEAGLDESGALVAAGSLGYLMVVTGRGPTVQDAQAAAYARARKVVAPNLRYRTDIGDRFVREDHETLRSLGYLDPCGGDAAGGQSLAR